VSTPSSSELLAMLADHHPASPREERSLAQIRRYVAWLPRPCDEQADPVHVTGSAVVLDGEGHTLLHRHKRLGIWLQPGGHVDVGESPVEAARREAQEETGIPLEAPGPGLPPLVHVDVHEGGRGHLHLDLRYLLLGDANAPFAPAPGESDDLAWVALDQLEGLTDVSAIAAVRAASRWLEGVRGGPDHPAV
jgi:8-oxo-dGTP pyrophosphatase MutT (NUDIX family)